MPSNPTPDADRGELREKIEGIAVQIRTKLLKQVNNSPSRQLIISTPNSVVGEVDQIMSFITQSQNALEGPTKYTSAR